MDESPKYQSVHLQPLFLVFSLTVFGVLIFLGYYLINLSDQENNLILNNIVVNTPTLIPSTLLPTVINTTTPSADMNQVTQDVISSANLYLNYLQEKEVENLFLLLTPDTKKLYSREDLIKALTQSELKITKFSLKDSIAFSNLPSSTIEISTEDKILQAVLPLTLNIVSKQGEKKSIDRELHAQYLNNLWLFDYLGPPDF